MTADRRPPFQPSPVAAPERSSDAPGAETLPEAPTSAATPPDPHSGRATAIPLDEHRARRRTFARGWRCPACDGPCVEVRAGRYRCTLCGHDAGPVNKIVPLNKAAIVPLNRSLSS